MKRRCEEIGAGHQIWFARSIGVLACMSIVATATPAERLLQLPTEEEIVRLRSTCAAWGQQILEGNFIRSALYQEQFSRYSPRTNRCYVEMMIHTNDLNKNSERFGQYLYDGQTREMLAFAQIQDGRKTGKVFDLQHRTTSFENSGWDDASEYIRGTMMDD